MQEKSRKENRAGRRSVKQWIALGLVIIGIPAVLLLPIEVKAETRLLSI